MTRLPLVAMLVIASCSSPPGTGADAAPTGADGGSRADEYERPCSGSDPCAPGFVCYPVGADDEERTCKNARVIACAGYWSEAAQASCGREIYGSRNDCFFFTRYCFNDELDQVAQCWEKRGACSPGCLPPCAIRPSQVGSRAR